MRKLTVAFYMHVSPLGYETVEEDHGILAGVEDSDGGSEGGFDLS